MKHLNKNIYKQLIEFYKNTEYDEIEKFLRNHTPDQKNEYIKLFYEEYVNNIQFFIDDRNYVVIDNCEEAHIINMKKKDPNFDAVIYKNKESLHWFLQLIGFLYDVQNRFDKKTTNMVAEMGLIKALDNIYFNDKDQYLKIVEKSAKNWVRLMNMDAINHVNKHIKFNWIQHLKK